MDGGKVGYYAAECYNATLITISNNDDAIANPFLIFNVNIIASKIWFACRTTTFNLLLFAIVT